jgi:C4-dicarboxylate transporter DctM subunit
MISSEMIGLLSLVAMIVILMLGVNIGTSLVLVGFVGLVMLIGFNKSLGVLMTTPFTITYNISFTILPLFVLMGEFAYAGGIASNLLDSAEKWLRRIPGGLAIATAVGCALFAMVTGSSTATVATFSKLAIPQMLNHNYDKRLAYGVVASSGSLAVLIPPSGLMVLYCIFTDVSLGKLMLAGFLPGALTVAVYTILIISWAYINPKLAPRLATEVSWKEKVESIKYIGPVVFVMVVMLGGIYMGVFTPTEAGAFGVLAVLIMAFLMRGMNFTKFKGSLQSTVTTSVMIFFIIIGAIIFGKFITISGLTFLIGNFITGLHVAPIIVLLVILFVYLILGAFLETVAMVSITLPIFYPIISSLGLNGIWVGILIIKLCEIGMITPPIGLNVFTVKAILGPSTKMEDVFLGIMPFLWMDFILVALLIIFPQISLWLPSLGR